jgi:hypothetical protein
MGVVSWLICGTSGDEAAEGDAQPGDEEEDKEDIEEGNEEGLEDGAFQPQRGDEAWRVT